MSATTHVFNLNPTRFRSYWHNSFDTIQRRVIDPAEALLRKRLTEEQKSRALRLAFGEEKASCMLQEISIGQVSANQFRKQVHAKISKGDYGAFDTSLDTVMQEIPFRLFKQELGELLARCQVRLSPACYAELILYVANKQKSRTMLTPYSAARLLQKGLIAGSPSHFLPLHHLERAVRQFYGIPEVIELGNLNWVKQPSERLDYYHLILKYDFFQKKVIFNQRCQGVDEALEEGFSEEIYTKASLFFSMQEDKKNGQ